MTGLFPSVPPPGIRAVIFDIYGTLLEVKAPPAEREKVWEEAIVQVCGRRLSLAAFNALCAVEVAESHAAGRAAGEPFPEVDWPGILRKVLPELTDMESTLRLSHLHASCSRVCTAMPGALAALAGLQAAGVPAGLASNAQHYTRRELAAAGFDAAWFDPALCFLSGDHGFAKPSPRVFSFLSARLQERGIPAGEILMVGDSMENDILPARAAGWHTWLVPPGGIPSGEDTHG